MPAQHKVVGKFVLADIICAFQKNILSLAGIVGVDCLAGSLTPHVRSKCNEGSQEY